MDVRVFTLEEANSVLPKLQAVVGRQLQRRARIEAALGRTVRFELALTAATVTAYPALKRGLGYATSCALHKLEV